MSTATVDVARLIDLTEAARRLGMTRPGVFYVVVSGRLPHVKTATGLMLVDERDVGKFKSSR